MRYFLILLTGLFLFGCVTPAGNYNYQPTKRARFYDSRGIYSGYSETSQYGTTRYYNKNGKFMGISK